MKEPIIRFSHLYRKMGKIENGDYVELLEVFNKHRAELSDYFVAYDTAYLTTENPIAMGYYPLPKTELLVLLLRSPKHDVVFTTIRRATPSKEAYYLKQRGNLFRVEITEEHGKA